MEGGLRCTLDYIPKYYFVFCLYNQQISCINTTNSKIPVEKKIYSVFKRLRVVRGILWALHNHSMNEWFYI